MSNFKWVGCLAMAIILLAAGAPCYGAQTLTATKILTLPVVDGNTDDPAWQECRSVVTRDTVADIDITIKAAYSDEKIFFLVQFPDPDESRVHKSFIWSTDLKMYEIGPEREDTFVFKWAMGGKNIDLSLRSKQPHKADIWFWKANRTDPAGYADDKYQILSPTQTLKSKKIQQAGGPHMYLQRIGDKGTAAYRASILVDFQGDKHPQFMSQEPSGSRADIRSKGKWKNKTWSIEFSRNLKTKHLDDIQFDISNAYFFGVSRYEIAGGKENPKWTQPLYGSGDVNETLNLSFKP